MVSNELVSFTVPNVDTAPRSDIYDRAGIPAVLGAVRSIIDLEFLHGADHRLERNLVVCWVAQVNPVNHVIDLIFPSSARIEREGTLAPQRRGQEAARRRSHGSGQQQSKIHEVTAI